MENILLRLEMIEKKIDLIIEKQNINDMNCKKMSEHIDFVENTYNVLREPLNYIKNKFDSITGANYKELPDLNNNYFDVD